ncbi:MAG: preprotein translocase subunit SecA [Ardenticatenales bacterium]|nr:preprotein translocase subunit SecA [Ardenticatenales bacterium]
MFKRIIKSLFGDPNEKELKKLQPLVDKINELEPAYERLSDEELRNKTAEFHARLEDGATLDSLLPEAFAAVREASKRTTGMRHFDVQLIGGIVLHQGKIAEQKTGEGKTLVASLSLYLNSLDGVGVHLVTPNDYLSKVGCQLMGPIYHALGSSVAVIQSQGNDGVFQPGFLFDPEYQSDDDRLQHLRPIPRVEAYAADITYGTNNEFGFDYLRDNMVRSSRQRVQRDLNYAIVDEVDNILIDEARTPLIISGPAEEPSEMYGRMANLVRSFRHIEQREYDELRKQADLGDEKAEQEIGRFQFVLDEKNRVTSVLESGVDKVERALNVENLYDPANFELTHFLDNAVRAHGVYQKDRDYVVTETDEVVIVDEFTGRMMWGRRFSEGLHQAIEAKEGVKVQRENMTLATITFQNFFRMYDKLAGMTGTALTEAEEFSKIYKLEVIAVPTHRPICREDYGDLIYKNERGKYNAVIEEIKQMHQLGRPVLVGTASIDRSETLSKLLSRADIPHEVLNAKQHEREAEIIAQAGRPGRVTIATNMAGRGVDILLGGNPEGIARRELRKRYTDLTEVPREEWDKEMENAQASAQLDGGTVRELGGLHILGTERHEARRIDNQLRGRAGRQGDLGSSRFYLSLEDELMRRFGGNNLVGIMDRLGLEEDMPIEHGMVSKAIESAQIKVEGHNFDIRKRVLEYDDVVNKQREVIYAQRTEVLESESLRPEIERMLSDALRTTVLGLLQGNDYDERTDYHLVLSAVRNILPLPESYEAKASQWGKLAPEEVVEELITEMRQQYDEREQLFGVETMREMERQIMLDIVDRHWIRHLTELDNLRQGIGLRAFAQQDPLVAYKTEAASLWIELIGSIEETMVHTLFAVRPVIAEQKLEQREMHMHRTDTSEEAPSTPQPVRTKERPGRNDPCHCGSGKKYKNCHWAEDQKNAGRKVQRPKAPAR